MNKKLVGAILVFNILLGLFFSLYKLKEVPPCLNADEVAFGYNAYSLLKTGKDEYGRVMPLRLESFKDFKLPLYSMLSVPIIGLFGYNDVTTRALNIVIMLLYIPLTYLIVKELWNDKRVALLASFLISLNPGLYILTRHAHEGPLCSLFILLGLYYLVKYIKQQTIKNFFLTNFFLVLSTFSYHYGRVFLAFFIFYELFLIVKTKKIISKNNIIKGLIIALAIFIPVFADAKYSLNRVNNLAFYQDKGYQLRITEYLNEHPFRPLHNKLVEALRDVGNRYLSQISPDFFIINGDKNWRFGMLNLSPISLTEYLFFFIGLYFLFHRKEKFRELILLLVIVSPVANALTWQGASLIRAYFILFPMIFVAAYGFIHFVSSFTNQKMRAGIIAAVVMLYGYYTVNSWDLYFNHYPKRAITIRAWQCGYKELGEYVEKNYDKFDKFYITDRQGQPYIFMLHYLKYDPSSYQKQAKISAPDGYGFGQVAKFDKFVFSFNGNLKEKNIAVVGYPDEVAGLPVDQQKIKKIKIGTEEIFWIYEN